MARTITIELTDEQEAHLRDRALLLGLGGDLAAALRHRVQFETDEGFTELERFLLEGLKSGEPIEADQAFWERQFETLAERTAQRTGQPIAEVREQIERRRAADAKVAATAGADS